MSMIRVQIPATCANLGPGLFSTALALRLHNTVDVSDREMGLKVRITGEGFSSDDQQITAFVLAALERYFRHINRAPAGLDITIDQSIPAHAGLGSERAIELACLLGVNLLLGSPVNREELVQSLALPRRDASAMIAAVRGGLVGSAVVDDQLVYKQLPINISRVGIVLPHTTGAISPFPDDLRITLEDARTQARGQAMSLHALAAGDLKLLSDSYHRIRYHSEIIPHIETYEAAIAVGTGFPKTAVTISGVGPALVVFAGDNLEDVVAEVQHALRRGTQSEVSSWIVPVDTQGVAISEMGGAVASRTPPVPVEEQSRQAN